MPIKFEDKENLPCKPPSPAAGVEVPSLELPASMIVFYWDAPHATPKQSATTQVGELTVRQGRPLRGQEANTLKAQKPWEKCNPPISRRTWFRRRSLGQI
jgi:hypothetical protein